MSNHCIPCMADTQQAKQVPSVAWLLIFLPRPVILSRAYPEPPDTFLTQSDTVGALEVLLDGSLRLGTVMCIVRVLSGHVSDG